MYIKLRKELRAIDLEMEDDYYRPEQEDYFAEEGIIDEFLNYWTSLDQQKDVMIETSKKEEPSIFETDDFCMYASDEQYLQDMFMQVAEQMKMLEEVTIMEQFLDQHVFKDTTDVQMMKTTMEAGGDESSEIWQRKDKQSGDKRKLQIAKEEAEERYEDSLMTGTTKSMYTVQSFEVMGLSLSFSLKNYGLVLIVNGQEIVLEEHNEALMEKDLTKYYTVEDARTGIYKDNSVQGRIASPEKAINRREKEDSQEHKDQLAEVDAQHKFEDVLLVQLAKRIKVNVINKLVRDRQSQKMKVRMLS